MLFYDILYMHEMIPSTNACDVYVHVITENIDLRMSPVLPLEEDTLSLLN